MSDLELVKNADAGRYEGWLDGQLVSLATYHERGQVVVLPHTETDPAQGGHGYAGQVVRFALEEIRSQRRTIEPACPFVADFIGQHPEYADLLGSK